jgi:putative FmdB family regulatory protein
MKMPIYEYECTGCGARFDKLFLSLSRIPAEIACPTCQSADTRRLISAPAVHTDKGGSIESGAAEAAAPAKSPVFGRKELNEATARKKELRERAAHGE